MSSSLSFVLRTFDWNAGNAFVWRERFEAWGAITPEVSVSKNPDFKTSSMVL